MKKHVFWRLFSAAVLTTVVWSAISLDVYGYTNNSNSGGTLLDVFRGRGSSGNKQEMADPSYSAAPSYSEVPSYSPESNSVSTPRISILTPSTPAPAHYSTPAPAHYAPAPAAPMPGAQPAVQNKWSLKSWLSGAAPNQPQSQYVEPAPPLTPAYNHPHSHASQQVMPSGTPSGMPSGKKPQYPVVPLDSKDFQPQEGAVYNEKGEMIYSPESGGAMPFGADGEVMYNGAGGEMVYDNNGENVVYGGSGDNVVYDNNGSTPYTESDSGVKRIISGRSNAGRSPAPVNQERVYSPAPVNPNGAVLSEPEPIPAQMPINPYAQQPSVSAGNPPVGTTGKAIISGKSGALKLDSGSEAFSKTYKPGPVRTSVPTEPEMDIAGPNLADALPQENESSYASASPVIEELHSASPLENLSEKSGQTPTLEPVPEIDIPKETVDSRQEAADSSANTQSVLQTPLEALQTDSRKQTADSSDSPETNSTPLATRNSQLATPLIVEIDGPDEVEFGKNEMFSLSVINTTDAVRRDIVLSVHPEGFGDDKTARLTLESLQPGEKKSVYMKLNARQYNNLSLTAQVRDGFGFETSKTISVNVKNESVKISIMTPQPGMAFVGQPTQYIVRIVNNASRDVSLSAVAFFGNGIEPVRASGAPNSIQSGQVVVNKPIELKQGEMRDLKIIAVAFQPGIHKILVQLIDSRGATYAAKESCAYRQREFDDNVETVETDARIELTPGKSEIGVWKAAGGSGNSAGNRQEAVDSSNTPSAPALNAPDAVPLTQPDQGSRGDLIMPMFAQ